MYEDILKYFNNRIREILLENICGKEILEEIRLRNNKPIILKFSERENVLELNITTQDILETLEKLCDNSIYSYQTQICEGYITVKGGHRIGITGNVVGDGQRVININYISGLNFRIARQIIGAANKVMPYIVDDERVYNTLIISPPASGKTTILRDIVRQISDITKRTVSVVDERGEIAAMYKGNAQNDMGIRTDVLDNCPKSIGMKMMIRSMSPEVIVADEIGKYEDIEAINYATCSGVKGIFTAHGKNLNDIELNPVLKTLLDNRIFERLIFLNNKIKGEIDKVYCLNIEDKKYQLLKN